MSVSIKKETNLYDDNAIKEVNDKVVAKYATSSTPSATVAKVATIADETFQLYKGARISVLFENANTANSPTLNVNQTGAKPIWAYGGPLSASGNTFNWVANSTIEFVYDGSHWLVADSGAVGLISKYDEKLTQEAVFNRLTNNGSIRGIFMKDGQMYINMDYLQTGTLKLGGANNGNGLAIVYDSSGNEIGRWDKDGLNATGDFVLKKVLGNETFTAKLGTLTYNQYGAQTTDYGFFITNTTGNRRTFTPQKDVYEWENVSYRSTDILGAASRQIIVNNLSPKFVIEEFVSKSYFGWINWGDDSGSGTNFSVKSRLHFGPTGLHYNVANVYTGSSTPFLVVDKDDNRIKLLANQWQYIDVTSANISIFANNSVGLYINSANAAINGHSIWSSSSKRYKHSITADISPELDAHKLYDLEMKQFVFNDGHLLQYDGMKGKTLPGFIAEDVAEIYPSATIYNAKGEIESWDERRIIPGMLALIQEQKKQLDEQAERIARLENQTSFIHIS